MGIEVPVFVGGEILANRLNLVNMYLHIEKPKRGHYVGTIVPLETTGIDNEYPITRSFLNALEAQIKETPELYLWTHKRWKYRKQN
jgi:KDO2-lipid IV(A) lauroyltransferase